jgi:hypothetical protein
MYRHRTARGAVVDGDARPLTTLAFGAGSARQPPAGSVQHNTLCPGGLFLFQCVEISALLTQIDQPDTMQGLYRVMT